MVQSRDRKRSTKNGAAASRMKCSGSNQATKRSGRRVLDAAEAQEGVHLVEVAPDRLRHRLEPVHERVARDLEELALAVQDAPEERVEERVALRVAVADHEADELGDGPRQRRPGGRLGRRRPAAEEVRRAARRSPRPPASRRRARPATRRRTARAEAVEIGAVGRATIAAQRSCEQAQLLAAARRAAGAGRPVECSPSGGGRPRRGRAARASGPRSAAPTSSRRSVRCRRAATILSTARAPRPGTRSSISRSARVHVDGKAVAVLQRPGELRVDLEVEHAVLAAAAISSTSKP